MLTELGTLEVSSRFFSVHRLNVAVTTCRSWTRRDHVRPLPDFIAPEGGGRIDNTKRLQRSVRSVGDTGESLTIMEERKKRSPENNLKEKEEVKQE
jgi:hypothetical protein